jgi:hypothetical protein
MILPVVLYGKKIDLRVSENKVLRRIFRPKREEVAGGWRKLHNEELRNLCTSPDIIRVIKSSTVKWVRHVARMGEKRNADISAVNLKGRDYSQNLRVDGRIILNPGEISWGICRLD